MPNRRVLALLALVFSFPAIAQTQITTFEKVGDKTVVCSHSGLTSSFKNIVKGVVASAINENGEEIFPRKWNDEYINAPMIDSQHQPSTTADSLTAIIDGATGHYRMLYAPLAGCGALRAGEALGLEVGKHISPDLRTLYVMEKAKRGEIQPYLKTRNGVREVDLCVDFAEMLKEYVGKRVAIPHLVRSTTPAIARSPR